MKKTKINRLKILEKLLIAKELDIILVFGSAQKCGELQFFTGKKPIVYHYFFIEREKPLKNGYYVPGFLINEVGSIKNVVTFDDENIPVEMKKFLQGKKRIGLIGGAPAFHFSNIKAKIIFLNDEICPEMLIRNEQEIGKIRIVSELTANLIKTIGKLIKAGALLSKISEIAEKKALVEADSLAFPPVIANIVHKPDIFNWFSLNDKVEKRDVVVVNLGVEKSGFYADVARMFFVNQPELANIYKIFEKIYSDFARELKPGFKFCDLADKLENLLAKSDLKGFSLDKNYLGHVIGLEIIERPFITTSSLEKLQENMTISLLAKIYRDEVELRIQNVVLIEKKGGKILSI